ncbi:PREDICTED: loss of heterozygosity 12 chromosomal region 1 protein homolog [Priapulus caudatus]|uniref:BLOC-1-related complex subunit 5 n=1 Tax=Priapulus caudatus TaxID=37621 RepID=A0ABM1E7F5_PRICU|nr:PREDICTED: loss of heterozygosity 12 chromosomal region 1 protein homolog [Priapulus caudatus]
MGSDNSTSTATGAAKPPAGADRNRSSPSCSSISSGDIPYTFYTVGRPIGDSPKHQPKGRNRLHGSPQQKIRERAIPKDIVVVKEGVHHQHSIASDPDLMALQENPTFLPIMRGALNVPSTSNLDALDKLDYRQVLLLCMRYQEHLRKSADVVQNEQNVISNRIPGIDFAISTLTNMLTDRQKKYAKHAEKMQRVHDIALTLNKSQRHMEQIMGLLQELNEMLPDDQRFEPFSVLPLEVSASTDGSSSRHSPVS